MAPEMGPGVNLMQMFDDIRDSGSDEMGFEVKRDPTPGQTFSKDAIDDLMKSIHVFIGARIAAHWKETEDDRTKPGPSTMSIRIKVGVDGDSWEVAPDVRPWYSTVDGKRRGESV